MQHIRSAHYQQQEQQSPTNGSGSSSSTSSSSSSISSSSSKLMTLTGGLVMANGNAADLLPPPSAPLPVSASAASSPAAFRCGVCHQVSNWKHVIQVFFSPFITQHHLSGFLTNFVCMFLVLLRVVSRFF